MKKLHTKKRRINSKKGISMVLAIALAAVLFLSTTTFLSIAMLQQKETGTTMNSRQAYVSAKSALDMAEELLNDGKLQLCTPWATLPATSRPTSSLWHPTWVWTPSAPTCPTPKSRARACSCSAAPPTAVPRTLSMRSWPMAATSTIWWATS